MTTASPTRQATTIRIGIDRLDANPFRHIDRYPIRESKIEALRESIKTTGFWDNMVGRVVGDRVQIAYGHHRREALRREYGPEHEVGIVVRDFDDDQMLKIMARENLEEWGSSAWVEMETVRAVVEAYGAGQIGLSTPDPRANASTLRYAPSFIAGDAGRTSGQHPYTAQEVADFLGWTKPGDGRPQDKVKTALAALGYIEQGRLLDSDFAGLGTDAASALVQETRRTVLEEQRIAEEARKRAERIEAERRAAEERAAKASEERAAALERAARAREQADRDNAERDRVAAEQQAEAALAQQQRMTAAAEAERRDNERRAREAAARGRAAQTAARDVLRRGTGGGGRAGARQAADQVRGPSQTDAGPRDFGRTVRAAASHLATYFTGGEGSRRLDEVMRYRKYLDDSDRDQLVAGLREMRDAVDRHLRTLGAEAPTNPAVRNGPAAAAEIVDAEIVDV